MFSTFLLNIGHKSSLSKQDFFPNFRISPGAQLGENPNFGLTLIKVSHSKRPKIMFLFFVNFSGLITNHSYFMTFILIAKVN